MRDPVDKEWRRLLTLLRKKGPVAATSHVTGLIREKKCHLWYVYKLTNHLLRRGEFKAAGQLLNYARRFGEDHPMIDRVYGTWLWSIGERKAAIRFIEKKARLWSQAYLYNLLSVMYEKSGEIKKAEESLMTGALLAEQELVITCTKHNGRSEPMTKKERDRLAKKIERIIAARSQSEA